MKRYILPIAIGIATVTGGLAYAAGSSEEAREKTVALSSVPKAAVDAARQALGTDPTEAKIISGTRPQQYELAAESGGKENAVHVRANGTIVKHETEKESAEHEKAEHGR
jgi:tetrahydromethanopterin S-methyltransferase subunit E